MLKRKRRDSGGGDDSEDDGPSTRPRGNGGGPTIGQQTSSIKNKQVRGELYSKLKHKQKVRMGADVCMVSK